MAAAKPRIPWLDLARTAALIAMAVYHAGFDLESVGRLAPGTMQSGIWYWYARAVAGSFLFLVGIGLWLAHGRAIRWRAFLTRLVQIMAGAALVTAATRYALGPYYVFFGILHSIAVSSVIGLAFLRLPAAVTAVAAAAAFLAPGYLKSDAFDAPWLLWTGLSITGAQAVDFEPTLPWLAPVLAGIAVARATGAWAIWGPRAAGSRLARVLAFPGRHSLAVYLIHQPVLIGCVSGLVWLGLI